MVGSAVAGPIAIVTGNFYTPDLRNQLQARGLTVVEINNYTAASLAPYDAVVHYGNTFVDFNALQAYASGGGTLVLQPWFWINYNPPAPLQIFTGSSNPTFSMAFPGVTVHAPGDSILAGVTFPAVGAVQIGRESGRTFGAGVTQVASYSDGTAMIGRRSLGLGEVIGINMHAITSDTAYQVINQSWASQLFANAVAPQQVPEPATAGLLALALVSFLRRRTHR